MTNAPDRPVRLLRLFSRCRGRFGTYARNESALDPLAAVRHIGEAVVGVAANHRIMLFNEAAETLLGYTSREVLGQEITLLLPHYRATPARRGQEIAAASYYPQEAPQYAQKRDATHIPVEIHVSSFDDRGQKLSLITIRDIGARQQAEARILRLSQMYQALSAITQVIRHPWNEQDLFDEVCRMAVDLGGVSMAWIGAIRGSEGRIKPIARYGHGLDYLAELTVSSNPDIPEGQGPSGIAFREGRSVVTNDTASDAIMKPWQIRAQHYHFRSAGSFPILRAKKSFAVLTVYHTQINSFDGDLIAILEDMANSLSFALDNADREHERRQAEERVAHSEQHFRAYFERAMIGMAAARPSKTWIEVNDALCAMLGYTRPELLQLSWDKITDPDDLPRSLSTWEMLLSGELNETIFEKTYIHKSGRPVYARIAARAVHEADNRLNYIVLLVEDITSRKHHEDTLARLGRILDESPNEIYTFDAQSLLFEFANAAALKNMGYSLEELKRLRPTDITPSFAAGQFLEHTAPLKRGEKTFVVVEAEHRRKDGTVYPLEARIHLSERKEHSVFVSVVQDMTERKRFEDELRHQSTHDALTGLPNRAFFHEILSRSMAYARRADTLVALLLLDIDSFKNINESLGHEYGDALLQELAQRLTAAIRKEDWITRAEDVVARQGGDEFMVLIQNIHSVHAATKVAERILAAIAQPFDVRGHKIHVTASMGITVYPFDDTDTTGLLRNADVAMYKAKQAGKNSFQFYTASMSAHIQEQRAIENGLRHAIENGELVLHYQPQIDLKSGELVGVEALIRWQHPDRGLVAPGLFIPIAEESSLIVAIGEWVLRTACEQSRAWRDLGLPVLRVAVNLAGRQFAEAGLPATVERILRETDLHDSAQCLELEVTESMLMEDTERTAATLQALHRMGVRLAIDDFGTGYSSLNYLKRFHIDSLKIDQSFVRDIANNTDDAAIATAIVTLGHNLGLTVIAEGVETEDQMTFLRAAQCDEIQGYYYSRPLPAGALEEWIKGGARRLAKGKS